MNDCILKTEMDLTCDHTDCEDVTATTLCHGVSVDDGVANSFSATYCDEHTESHVEPRDDLVKIGELY